MQTLVVLVGLRGAGKSTLLRSLRSLPEFLVLTPTSTRPPRSIEDDEYFHVPESDWKKSDMAWEIAVSGHKYGMTHKQLRSIPPGRCPVTVFDPSSLATLEQFRRTSPREIVTIGLDTIASLAEQHHRVDKNSSRMLTASSFDQERKVVANCDVALRGPAPIALEAVIQISRLLTGRGGIVDAQVLASLVQAGTLLLGANADDISTASCDLRLGDSVWCQGKHQTLTDNNPFFSIPAYSYAIVSAREIAELPKFMAGRFDLKLTLFFNGVILSNGPQVDPGYKGALFCLLYNGSDSNVGIYRDSHFATIEFCTTSVTTAGYLGRHQGRQKLSDFLPENAAGGKGGQILERLNAIETPLRAEWNTVRNGFWGLFALVVGILSLYSVVYWNMRNDVRDTLKELRELSERIRAEAAAHEADPARRVREEPSPATPLPIPTLVKTPAATKEPAAEPPK